MRYIVILLTIILPSVLSFSQEHHISYKDSSYFKIKMYKTDYLGIYPLKDELPDGEYWWYYDSTHLELAMHGTVSGQKKNGLWTNRSRDGKFKETTEYKNNLKHGKRKFFNMNDELVRIENYRNDTLNGKIKTFFDATSPDSRFPGEIGFWTYKNGLKNGKAVYTNRYGSQKVKEEYKNGLLDGLSKHYLKTGELNWIEKYTNGRDGETIITQGLSDETTYVLHISGDSIHHIQNSLNKLENASHVRELYIILWKYNKELDSLIVHSLKSIPHAGNIRKIMVRGYLSKIPEGVYKCTNLEELWFEGLTANEISPEISNLRKLRLLHLSHLGRSRYEWVDGKPFLVEEGKGIDPKDIIDKISNLPCLEELYFIGGYQELPANIGSLQKLKGLFLVDHGMTMDSKSPRLIPEMTTMKNLRVVQFAGSHFREDVNKYQPLMPHCNFTGYETCLSGNTTITMKDGSYKKLLNMQVGDKILSYIDGQVKEAEVEKIHHFNSDEYELFRITLDASNVVLEGTANHPVLMKSGEWKRINQLKNGDIIFLLDSVMNQTKEVVIHSITELTEKVSAVYNIKTSSGNYFANGILVHNK